VYKTLQFVGSFWGNKLCFIQWEIQYLKPDCAMSQAIRHWFLITEAYIWWGNPCGICDGQSSTGAGSSLSIFAFPHQPVFNQCTILHCVWGVWKASPVGTVLEPWSSFEVSLMTENLDGFRVRRFFTISTICCVFTAFHWHVCLQKRREEAEKNRSLDVLRAAVVCVLGHVDTGENQWVSSS
jgi:hypothetical protein